MKKEEVITLARELFKIRVSAAREGLTGNDGVHTSRAESTKFFDDKTMIGWYAEAVNTAKNIINYEEHYLIREIKNESYSAN